MKLNIRDISSAELYQLEQMYLARFHEKGVRHNEFSRHWFNVVLDYLETTGHEVVPKALIDAEESLLKHGLASEYFAALAEGVGAHKPNVDADTGAILVVTATVDERAAAVALVRRNVR